MEDQVEKAEDFDAEESAATLKRWQAEVRHFERKTKDFYAKADKIIQRYRAEKGTNRRNRLNVFWANVETLKPTIYAQAPKPEIKRRHDDQDPVGRVASQILERAAEYYLDCEGEFDAVMGLARNDLLTVGLGVSWQRYVPEFGSVQVPADQEPPPEGVEVIDGVWKDERKTSETVHDDYVYFKDFGWNVGARTWNEVYAVWRKAYMTREELKDRFPDCYRDIPLNHKPEDMEGEDAELFKKAVIYELWDRSSGNAIWFHETYQKLLDTKPDPLGLEGFFPCPKPMFATQTTGTLIPVPDYVQYEDQIQEIDELTGRIEKLTESLKLRGLYAANQNDVQRLLKDGNEADLIPVTDWGQLAQNGGLQNAVVWLPLKEVADALIALYEARERAKQDMYEVTGLSDILRGASDADETATAQAIKAQWGSVRVRDRQKEVQRFARDNLRIKVEILAEHFDPEKLAEIASIETFTAEDQQFVPDALALIKNDKARGFRIDVETDSTIAPDEMAEKQARTEFVSAVSQFVQAFAEPIAMQPALAPMAGKMLTFAVRGFKVGEELETIIEQTMGQIAQAAMQPPEPPAPDPTEEVKLETEKVKAQAGQMKAQADMTKAQADVMKSEADVRKAAMDVEKTQIEASRPQLVVGGNNG